MVVHNTINEQHTLILEFSGRQRVNTLITIESNRYAEPVREYGIFPSIYHAIRHYETTYRKLGFDVGEVKVAHVHGDTFTAEFVATQP